MNKLEIPSLDSPIISNEDVFNLSNLPQNTKPAIQGTYDQLNQLLNNQDQKENTIREARDILDESARNLTDTQVLDLVNEVQFLVESWLDEFERNTFNGNTLDELLGLKP